MILRLSEKLGKKIRVTPMEKRPLSQNPFADFSCQTVSAGGHDYIVAANTASLYAVVFPADAIDRSSQFELELYDRLKGYIENDGFEFLFKRLIKVEGDTVSYSRPLNDNISASLNFIAERVASELKNLHQSTDEVTEKLNLSPLPLIRHQRPRDRFRALKLKTPA